MVNRRKTWALPETPLPDVGRYNTPSSDYLPVLAPCTVAAVLALATAVRERVIPALRAEGREDAANVLAAYCNLVAEQTRRVQP